jgi:hypothetical protein
MSDTEGSPRAAGVPGVLVVLMVALVAAAAAFGYLWVRDRGTDPTEINGFLQTRLLGVTERAHTATELLMDYTSGTLEERSERLLAVSTGDFQEQYQTLLEGGLSEALSKANTTAKARIVDGPDASFLSSDDAVAIVRVIQTAKKEGAPLPRRIYYVLRFALTDISPDQENPDWRISELRILSQQST